MGSGTVAVVQAAGRWHQPWGVWGMARAPLRLHGKGVWRVAAVQVVEVEAAAPAEPPQPWRPNAAPSVGATAHNAGKAGRSSDARAGPGSAGGAVRCGGAAALLAAAAATAAALAAWSLAGPAVGPAGL
jgi:hypothetical protein